MEVNQSAADYCKFCPGEEQVKISDAICRGRRRTHFPKCHGCRFNDDEKPLAAPSAADSSAPAPPIENLLRPHDICGPVPALRSADVAWRIGYAAAQFLHGRLRGYDRADPMAKSLLVGRDLRPESAEIQRPLIQGIRTAGVDVIDVGLIDTPQLYFAVYHLGAGGGLQTTGGSLPAGYNGFIICGSKGAHITTETGLVSIRDIALRVPKHQTGAASQLTEKDLTGPYRDFVRGALRGRDRLVKPLRVVIDASNGVAGRWVPILFDDVENLTVTPLNFEPAEVFHHDPNPTDPANTRDLRRLVKETKADFGVCFDGDASSCAFIDERGNVVRSDRLAGVLARMFVGRHAGAAVVLDLRSTRAAFEEIERAGGVPLASRPDIVSMKRAMSEHGAVFGADLDGRFYFRDGWFGESATLAFTQVLNLLTDSDRKLGDLIRPLCRYRSTGELSFPCPDPARAIQQLAAACGDAEITHFEGLVVRYPDWWFIARPEPARPAGVEAPRPSPRTRDAAPDSGPAVLITLEARTQSTLDEKLAQLPSLLAGQT